MLRTNLNFTNFLRVVAKRDDDRSRPGECYAFRGGVIPTGLPTDLADPSAAAHLVGVAPTWFPHRDRRWRNGIKIPKGYRDWKVISVAQVGPPVNDLRIKLGNDKAIKAYSDSKLPFPDGAIIARLATTKLHRKK